MDVPLVDMSQDESVAAAQVRKACTETGFFYVVNHGVDEALVGRAFKENEKFFTQPLEEKMKILADMNNRGYTPFAEETLDPANSKFGDTKEGLYFGWEVPSDSEQAKLPLHGPNQWPDSNVLPDFRKVTEEYFDAVVGLGRRLLRLLALSLDLPAEYFDAMFDPPMVFLRPLHYNAEVSQPGDGLYAAGAHTDYGMLTLLRTDSTPGLQINTGAGWQDVPPVPEAFIINLGDMLERWTNGHYRSTMHRVINTAGRERYSIPFFFEPNFHTRVECLPQCTSEADPPKHPPTTAGRHLLDKYAQTHAGYHGPVSTDGVKAAAAS